MEKAELLIAERNKRTQRAFISYRKLSKKLIYEAYESKKPNPIKLLKLAEHAFVSEVLASHRALEKELEENLSENIIGESRRGQEDSDEPDEEADEAGDPDDRREGGDEDANNAEEADDEEPEPPQPVHVPAKAPISPEMIETLRKRLNR